MVEFTKDEVLGRDELILDESIEYKHFHSEGEYPTIQFWGKDGYCYVPVAYKAQRFKLRVNIKQA